MLDDTNIRLAESEELDDPSADSTVEFTQAPEGYMLAAAAKIDWVAWRAEIKAHLARDPFYIGSRSVKTDQNEFVNGKSYPKYEQIPLTLEDLLDAREDDHVVQVDPHATLCAHLFILLRNLWREHSVFHDHLIHWGVRGLGNHGPDLVVFDNQRMPVLVGGTLRLTHGEHEADLVVEVTSLSTMEADFDRKPPAYHRAGARNYLIADIASAAAPQLLAYRYERRGYIPVEPDHEGWIPLPIGGHRIRFVAGTLNTVEVCDSEGNRVNHPENYLQDLAETRRIITEQTNRANQEKKRADKEKRAKLSAQNRAKREKDRADTEKQAKIAAQQRADTEEQAKLAAQQRANAEKERADAAVQARIEAENRVKEVNKNLRELKARLAKLERKPGSKGGSQDQS